MKTPCAYCGKECEFLLVKKQHYTQIIDFCCYEHYLKFWRRTRGFQALQKCQEKNSHLLKRIGYNI